MDNSLSCAEIYLDANATTPVLPQARAAALAAMTEGYGNPSSVHAAGRSAQALLAATRACARRVLGAASGQLLFTSGATEGIQTAVLSALQQLRLRRQAGDKRPLTLLVGATEHKAVPQALAHWNALLGLDLPLQVIPVDGQGRHDLAWLRAHIDGAGLVCTMAANNETGVISELDAIGGIVKTSRGTDPLWLVDGVQALGKLPLQLEARGIDYAPFSGHKLYAPKGVGLLYVRKGAPCTPLQAGGGQEDGLRAGTENMAGIAALGAVLQALESGGVFASHAQLVEQRAQLAQALRQAFPGLVFNAPFETSLPTTLNVAVPGLPAGALLDLLDAAGIRASGGSACGAAQAQPSPVLQAMGLPEWQAAGAVRLSFGAADDPRVLAEACRRLQLCGRALREAVDVEAGELARWLDGPDEPLLVDLREADEAAADGSAAWPAPPMQQVPLSALLAHAPRWQALPAQQRIVFCCRSGRRSTQAARLLRGLGRPACYSLAGGLQAAGLAGGLPAAGLTGCAIMRS